MGEPHLDAPTSGPVKEFLLSLQEEICAALEKCDGKAHFRRDEIERPAAVELIVRSPNKMMEKLNRAGR